jgi:hypothetical protein
VHNGGREKIDPRKEISSFRFLIIRNSKKKKDIERYMYFFDDHIENEPIPSLDNYILWYDKLFCIKTNHPIEKFNY